MIAMPVLCVNTPEGILHKVETTLTGHTIFECASFLKDKSLVIRLNCVSNPADAVANDVIYHLRCYINWKREAGKEDPENIQNLVDNAQVIADIEIINLVETKIALGQILNNNMIHTTYKNMLLENGMQPERIRADYKKYLKRLISENVPDAKFVKGYRANEPMNICSSRTESRAIDIEILMHSSRLVNCSERNCPLILNGRSKGHLMILYIPNYLLLFGGGFFWGPICLSKVRNALESEKIQCQ